MKSKTQIIAIVGFLIATLIITVFAHEYTSQPKTDANEGAQSGLAESTSVSTSDEDLATASTNLGDTEKLFKDCSLTQVVGAESMGRFNSVDSARMVFEKALSKSWKITSDANNFCDCFDRNYSGVVDVTFTAESILDMNDYQVFNAYYGDPVWDVDYVFADEASADNIFSSYYCRTSDGTVFMIDISSDGNYGDIMFLDPDSPFVYGIMMSSIDTTNDRYDSMFKDYYQYCNDYYSASSECECSDPTALDPSLEAPAVSDEQLLNNAYAAINDYCADYEGSLYPDCAPKNGKVNRTGSVAYVTVSNWDMQIWWNGYIPKDATVLLDEGTGTVMQCTVNY